VLAQSLLLGAVQLATAAAVDVSVVTAAGFVARWFAARPGWLKLQRWFLGGAFGALAAWLALDRRTA
jgi:threonine/homoserine/homoserine lactone efflux protein